MPHMRVRQGRPPNSKNSSAGMLPFVEDPLWRAAGPVIQNAAAGSALQSQSQVISLNTP